MEQWKDVPGYEGRYQVSDLGRVKSVSFLQRYLLRNGKEAFRWTRPRILATQMQNSGYLLAHLHLNNKRKAITVHTLVALAFLPSRPFPRFEVNHKNGVKTDCSARNLEWVSRTDNKLHAVAMGLNTQAKAVVSPSGKAYPSITQAAKAERVPHRTATQWVTL